MLLLSGKVDPRKLNGLRDEMLAKALPPYHIREKQSGVGKIKRRGKSDGNKEHPKTQHTRKRR